MTTLFFSCGATLSAVEAVESHGVAITTTSAFAAPSFVSARRLSLWSGQRSWMASTTSIALYFEREPMITS